MSVSDFSHRSAASSALLGLESAPSSVHDDDDDDWSSTFTASAPIFCGAILSPNHARQLTPSQCLAIAAALTEHNQTTSIHRKPQQQQQPQPHVVAYTLWITEAWRILGWAEPSAALFWEMATMYHALYLVRQTHLSSSSSHDSQIAGGIPPILSCGSTSSMGSAPNESTTSSRAPASIGAKKVTAKELPVWLVGTFLLLHTEELAYGRNLAGQDEQRFFATTTNNTANGLVAARTGSFGTQSPPSSLSPRYV